MKDRKRANKLALATSAVLLGATALFVPGLAHADTPNSGVKFSGTTTPGSTLSVASSFKNLSASGTYVLDTEIYNSANQQVAQFFNSVYLTSGQSLTETYAWNTTGKAAGTYQARQGTFTANWASVLQWRNEGGSVTLGSSTQSSSASRVRHHASAAVTTSTSTTSTPKPTTTSTISKPTTTTTVTTPVSGDPLSGVSFYGPNPSAAAQATAWASSNPADAALMTRLASIPGSTWFGDWNSNIQSDVNATVTAAAAQNKMPVLVAYNIPNRDCGGYSSGGAASDAAYVSWITSFAAGITGHTATVILEPDSLGVQTCLNATELAGRYNDLSTAVHALRSAGALVYIDASNWVDASTMAGQLQKANIAEAQGFALNTSSFQSTASMNALGAAISAKVGGKHWVVDTSRNGAGNGGNGQWCNPPNQALGPIPTGNTGVAGADAYIWIKTPGGSDGSCNGAPAAGVWYPSYALMLAQNAWG